MVPDPGPLQGQRRRDLRSGRHRPWPAYTDKLDYELEVCAVIGASGRRIAATDASRHIVGYTLYNDWSARDIQSREMSIGIGRVRPAHLPPPGASGRRSVVQRHTRNDALLLRGAHRVDQPGADAATR
ncbi:hypothetical protein GKO32_31235 [Amycolatopsis sp. RM579]|uniref:Fumarylacetoacetase-like C-terminal domain-containing protein n=1 Tax=Amycolatopsis pithecellobii TaxID=664692 RepID=A0A6N7Z9L7_9PSEU|nr:hypothetical protein [Amycolatopsis pithecellobii]